MRVHVFPCKMHSKAFQIGKSEIPTSNLQRNALLITWLSHVGVFFYWRYDSTAKINYRLFNSLPSSVFQTFSTIIKGELDSSTRIMATTPKENKSQTLFLAMWKCQMTATDGFIQYMHPFLFQKNVLLHGTFGIGNKDGKRKKIPAWSETAINSVVDTHSHTFPTSKGGVFSLCVLSEHRGERAAC